jgi:hypothetical protein
MTSHLPMSNLNCCIIDRSSYPRVRGEPLSKGRLVGRPGAGGVAGLGADPVLGRPGGGLVPGLLRGAARPRARGGEGEGDGEVAADGGAERARGAGDLHARRAPPAAGVASVCLLAFVGAHHPWPPARHWAAKRRHPSPQPAARVRARPRGCLLAGPSDAWPHAGAPRRPAGRRRARGTRGGRPVSGERRAGG